MPRPSVGRIVHYVSYGTPGGEYTSQCRAAIVSEVDPRDPRRIGLIALNPTGLFFHGLSDGGCVQEQGSADLEVAWRWTGGTWHWPERTED